MHTRPGSDTRRSIVLVPLARRDRTRPSRSGCGCGCGGDTGRCGCAGPGTPPAEGAAGRTYVVPDMSCAHCERALREALTALPGVERVDVDLAGKTVRVHGAADDAAVRAAIDDAGYESAA
jgi:copper chaperone